MLPSETMIWQPEFTDKTLSRKPGAVQSAAGGGEGTCFESYTQDVANLDEILINSVVPLILQPTLFAVPGASFLAGRL
ncbi:hypothetical protein C5P27_24920 [Escherichia coli]|nr:hypothetical protein C5P27_24920 [Escherichia coli]